MSTKKELKNRKKKHKLITKGHGNEPTVIEFNLSKAVILLIIIGVVIAGLVTKEIVTTIIKARQNKVLAEETSDENAVYVQSSDGIQVPVPKGYVASQIPGETSVNGGFVIYEDNYNGQPIDWNSILVETNSLSANSLNANNAINSATPQATTENQAKEEEQLKTEQTNTTENTTTETTNTTTTTDATNVTETTNTESTNNTESTTTGVTNSTENTTIETTNKTQATNKTESTDTKPTNVTGSTNTEQTNTETTRTEPTNTKPTTTSTNTISTSTTTTATETETNKTTKDLTTGNEKEENKTESTIESNKTETQKVTETTNTVENKAEVTNTEPTTASTNTTTTQKTIETTNESPKVQTNAQTTSKESSIELYADGTITQEDINIFNLQKSVNQFVWVPVNDISRIYGVDSNGKLWGKLYDYDETGRTPLNWTENGKMSITNLSRYREPAIVSDYDTDSQLQTYLGGMTAYELLAEMEENYYEAIKSIEKYGGFYIGRYETGGLSETAVVRKMETDINNQTWYTMYEKMKEISGSNDSVMTSMIWGSLWDETLQWLIDSKATISDGTEITYELVGNNSTLWGNYYYSIFNYIPEGATEPNPTAKKGIYDSSKIPTGSSEYTKVNNIYDMAGNVYDWTLEAGSVGGRVLRGGYYVDGGFIFPAAARGNYNPTGSYVFNGARALLYIK